MSTFELDEAEVARVEQLLQDTGEAVQEQARQASGLITDVASGGWQGGASRMAMHKQTDEFGPAATKLFNEIHHISEALGMGRVLTLGQDQEDSHLLGAVTPDAGGVGGTNYSRLV